MIHLSCTYSDNDNSNDSGRLSRRLETGNSPVEDRKWGLSKLEEVMKRLCPMGRGSLMELRAEGLQVKTASEK